jgi:hypothetical protein
MSQINPFQGPINYAVEVQSPFEAAIGGFKIGQAGAEMQAQAQAREQKQKFQTGLSDFFKKTDRTYEDLEQLLPFADKQQFDALTKVGEGMEKRKLDTEKRFSAQTLLALESNVPVAKTMLQERAEAEKDPNQKRAFEAILNTIDVDPIKAAQMLELTSAATFGKDWYQGITDARKERRTEAKAPAELIQANAAADKAVADAITAQATATNADQRAKADADKAVADAQKAKVQAQYAEKVELANLEKTGWDVKNLRSQIGDRSSRLNLDIQKTAADVADKMSQIKDRLTSLPESAQKLVNESAVNASTAKQASNQYTEIAKQLDGLGSSWGALNSLGEWSKSQFGNQDFRTAIQNEYTRLANSAGIKAYKAAGATGGFSDADLNTALQGIPKANANPQIMAQFMRGMAKEQAIAAALDNAKTDWLTQNKGQLGRAGGTFLAGDYAVKPGETYADFSARVTKDVVKRFTTPAQSSLVSQIPTDANPRPAAPAANIRSQADAILRGGQ